MKTYLTTLIVGIIFLSIPTRGLSQVMHLDSLCDNLYHSSNKYIENGTEYRVVKWSVLNVFFNDIKTLDSNKSKQLETASLEYKDLEENLASQQKAYNKLNADYKYEVELNDGMEFLTMIIPKKRYNLIMWSLVIILMVVLVVLFLMFNRCHQLTIEAKQKLEEKTEEFEGYRKRALKREQEVSSGYLREINKLKAKLN